MVISNDRIFGYDFVWGIVIIGMIIVNFKMVMVVESSVLFYWVLNLFFGKVVVFFVVLAGIGMILMYESGKCKNSFEKLSKVKLDLFKWVLFLFVIGLSYYFIWLVDILYYYGVYMIIGVFLFFVFICIL